jgi:hypothetical protein
LLMKWHGPEISCPQACTYHLLHFDSKVDHCQHTFKVVLQVMIISVEHPPYYPLNTQKDGNPLSNTTS